MARQRVLIADDHALVAEGLSSLLSTQHTIVGISPNGRQLLADAVALKPDIIVLDIGMPELNGIEAARQLSRIMPRTKIIFVTQQIDAQYLRAAFRAGCVAYVAKQSAASELLMAISRAMLGFAYVTPLLANAVPNQSLKELRSTPEFGVKELTTRQREVLQLVAEGRTIKEISQSLKISPKTVEFHKNALMNETGLRTTADLTRYALQHGVIAE